MCVPPAAQALVATGPSIDVMSERAIAAAGASAWLTLRPTSASVGAPPASQAGKSSSRPPPPTSRRCPRCQRRRLQRRQQRDRRRRRARGDNGDEDDGAGGASASPTGSYYVDSHGHDLYIGHLTSVHACGAAIGELDLRLLPHRDRRVLGTSDRSWHQDDPHVRRRPGNLRRRPRARPRGRPPTSRGTGRPLSRTGTPLLGPGRPCRAGPVPGPAARGRLGHGPPTVPHYTCVLSIRAAGRSSADLDPLPPRGPGLA